MDVNQTVNLTIDRQNMNEKKIQDNQMKKQNQSSQQQEIPFTGYKRMFIDQEADQIFSLYQGQFVNGLFEGLGTIYKRNGNRYEGEFKNGRMQGFGKHFYKNGNRYQGEHKYDLPHGFGIYYYSDGRKQEGSFSFSRLQGFAKDYSAKGQLSYVGQYKRDRLNGFGKTFQNSFTYYEGDFIEDKFHGFGKLYIEKGNCFQGQFQKGVRQGFGKQSFQYQTTQDQKIKQGKFTIITRYSLISKYRYQGFFKNNRIQGFGKWFKPHCQISYGYHCGLKKLGFCIYFFESGQRFEGLYKNNLKNGLGKHYYSDGRRYQGFYKDDKKIGFGKMFVSRGRMMTTSKRKKKASNNFMKIIQILLSFETDFINYICQSKFQILSDFNVLS